MYHEEAIINGKLCWRGTPNGEWIEYTKEQLTLKLQEARQTSGRDLYEKAPWWANPDLPPLLKVTC